MYGSISERSGFRFAIYRRRSGSCISRALCLSSSIAVTRFIIFTLRSTSMKKQDQSPAPLRLVTWNIEKGKRWDLLQRCLDMESIRSADVLCLNEVDDG